MSLVSPAFAFPVPAQPLVLAAALSLASRLGAGRNHLASGSGHQFSANIFGGSDAAGRWSVHDAHAARTGPGALSPAKPGADRALAPELADSAGYSRAGSAGAVPEQSQRRTDRVATVRHPAAPRLDRRAGVRDYERRARSLEPSAGTGMLAVWADKAKATARAQRDLAFAPRMPGRGVPSRPVTHDGELIDETARCRCRPEA